MNQKKMSRNASLKCLLDGDQKRKQAQKQEQDDQEIQHKPIQHNYDFDNELVFKMQVLRGALLLKEQESQRIPAMITILPKEQKELVKAEKAGVDLVCVIDKSGSMQGDKMQSVKQTLRSLLDFLTEGDRLCLIQFDSVATRLCPFLKIDEVNKPLIHEIIKKISASGETSIYQGMKIAVHELENRRYINNVAAIFLLSDGQDQYAKNKVGELLSNPSEYIYTIHSFGYGQDHDPELMTAICQMKKGSFYFIDNVSLLEEYFVSALGGLQTVIAEEIKIELESLDLPEPYNSSIAITQVFGSFWTEVIPGKKYVAEIFHLAQGLQKNLVFEFETPKMAHPIEDIARQQSCFRAKVQLRNTASKELIVKQDCLEIQFYAGEEQLPPLVPEDYEVQAELFRVNAMQVFDDAMKACIAGKHEEAEEQIKGILQKIEGSNPEARKLSQQTVFQLQQGLKACSKKQFSTYGYSQMHSIRMISQNQFGLSSYFDNNGLQTVQYNFSSANRAQTIMSYHLKLQKKEETAANQEPIQFANALDQN